MPHWIRNRPFKNWARWLNNVRHSGLRPRQSGLSGDGWRRVLVPGFLPLPRSRRGMTAWILEPLRTLRFKLRLKAGSSRFLSTPRWGTTSKSTTGMALKPFMGTWSSRWWRKVNASSVAMWSHLWGLRVSPPVRICTTWWRRTTRRWIPRSLSLIERSVLFSLSAGPLFPSFLSLGSFPLVRIFVPATKTSSRHGRLCTGRRSYGVDEINRWTTRRPLHPAAPGISLK